MNSASFGKAFILFLSLLLSACGGGGSGGNDNPPPTGTTISGTALAPSGAIAQLAVNKPMMLAALDFLIPPSQAAVTGLTPVANATVELVRIDDNGDQVGAVLAATTTDTSGAYTLELPASVNASADLVVQINNSSGVPVLRAMVTGDTVNIDPVSQFILSSLINEPGLVLAGIDIATIETLVQQIEAIDIDFSLVASLEAAESTIAGNSEISQAVETVVAVEDANSLIVGAWGNASSASDAGMLVFYADGAYINYHTDPQDCPDGGVEYGSYSLDGSSLTVTPTTDQNGQCGLKGPGDSAEASYTVDIVNDGNQLELTSFDTDTQSNETASFPSVSNGNPDSIVGAWDVRFASDDVAALVFYSNGFYIQHQDTNDLDPCPGVEYGTYSYDGSTITGNIIRDDNLDCGLGDGTGGFSLSTVTVSDNVITFDGGPGDTVSFDRVGTITPISFDMTLFRAVSEITSSDCPGVPGGWDYSFTSTSMTLTGTDGWQSPGCTLLPEETFTLNLPQAADFDIPFNCAGYPICTLADFNGEISGIDQDNRQFTSTYSFDSVENILTYTKSVESTTFIETITLQPLP